MIIVELYQRDDAVYESGDDRNTSYNKIHDEEKAKKESTLTAENEECEGI